MRRASLLLIVVLLATAEGPAKKAWEYTDEERIALRTDPELARERVRESVQREAARVKAGARPPATPNSPSEDYFEGSTHPELFLPSEVFRSLMTLAFPEPQRSGEEFRKALSSEAERLEIELPADFWKRLQSISKSYLADTTAESDLGRSIQQLGGWKRRQNEELLALKQRDVCGSRAEAIAAARKEFGRKTFDRFLYEVIAVNKFHSEDPLPTPELLRWVEGGCR